MRLCELQASALARCHPQHPAWGSCWLCEEGNTRQTHVTPQAAWLAQLVALLPSCNLSVNVQVFLPSQHGRGITMATFSMCAARELGLCKEKEASL